MLWGWMVILIGRECFRDDILLGWKVVGWKFWDLKNVGLDCLRLKGCQSRKFLGLGDCVPYLFWLEFSLAGK